MAEARVHGLASAVPRLGHVLQVWPRLGFALARPDLLLDLASALPWLGLIIDMTSSRLGLDSSYLILYWTEAEPEAKPRSSTEASRGEPGGETRLVLPPGSTSLSSPPATS